MKTPISPLMLADDEDEGIYRPKRKRSPTELPWATSHFPASIQSVIDEMVERTLTGTSNSPLFRFQSPFRLEPKDYAYWLQEARRRKKSHQFDFRSPDVLSYLISRSAISEGQFEAGSYPLSTGIKPKLLADPGHVGDGGKDAKIDELQEKIQLLELELNATLPYSQLYRLGAAAIFVSIISIVVWLATGVGIPFHPVFAFGVLPTGIGLVGIAFAIRRDRKQKEKK